MDTTQAIELIQDLTKVSTEDISIKEDGFLSRGFVIDHGRIIFKFPRQQTTSYVNEIEILNFLNNLDLNVNLQKVGWTSETNEYLGLYGVEGTSLESLTLTDATTQSIGSQLGLFLKKLHAADMPRADVCPVLDEITGWQDRYLQAKEYIVATFSERDRTLLDEIMNMYMPQELQELGENLVFSHGDLGEGNILIDDAGKVGVIDFNESGYFDEAADFMDLSNDMLRSVMLDTYGADDILRKKVALRRNIRPLIVLQPYLKRGDQVTVAQQTKKIRETIEKYSLRKTLTN